MADLGIIRPTAQGRWVWPLAEMEIGDWFLVDKGDRETGRVRNLVAVSGHRISKTFSVTGNEVDGFTKVERVHPDRMMASTAPSIDYGTASGLMERYYGRSFDEVCTRVQLDASNIRVGEVQRYEKEQIEVPVRADYVLWIRGRALDHISMRPPSPPDDPERSMEHNERPEYVEAKKKWRWDWQQHQINKPEANIAWLIQFEIDEIRITRLENDTTYPAWQATQRDDDDDDDDLMD